MTANEARRLKVLMVAPTPFFADRGMHIRILEEARALVRRGHRVMIATYHIGSDIPAEENPGIEVRRIRRLLFWYRKLEAGPDWQKIVLDLLLIRKTFTLARHWRPDVIHAHNHEGVAIAWAAMPFLRMFGIRPVLVADLQGSMTREMVSHAYLRGGWLRTLFRALESWIEDMGDVVVASSWASAEEISSLRTRGGVGTVLDGARNLPPLSLEARTAARSRYGIGPDETVAVYTGAFVRNKGIGTLVSALPIAFRSDPRLRFVLAGSPRDLLTPLLSEAGVADRVTVISPLPYFSLGEVLGMGDIAIEPKHEDTGQASGKMLQYMNAGLPVACFDTMNNRKYLDDGGSFADEATPESLAEAIVALSRERDRLPEIGRANRERSAGFSWDATGEALEKTYRSVL
ncbi:MAG: glycosyltransferase family 4 protein [Candidatus Moranbacteria bacterium]|nr:glycosyltransferase family 4 protein [Candidatus Moranbacteria bacterium]NTW45747.1 glycosyltransferase family 4 protein [Candidatus Moranbacteria bacterium]